MIDLEKLRELAQDANTAEQWYAAHDMTSCSYDYDKAFIAASSPAVVLELIDHIVQLERDAGRLDWIEKNGDVRIQKVRAGFNGPIRWDVEYGPYDEEARSKKDMRTAIDTAMEAKHG